MSTATTATTQPVNVVNVGDVVDTEKGDENNTKSTLFYPAFCLPIMFFGGLHKSKHKASSFD